MKQLAALLMALFCALRGGSQPADTEAIAEANEPAVVVIFGNRPGSDVPVQSSGCVVHPSSLILSTAHQVAGLTGLRAKLPGQTPHPVEIVELSETHELALLRLSGSTPKTVRLGRAETLRNGSFLLSIASPKGLNFTTVTGTVSSIHRTYKGFPAIQADLPASPGSSGGPVFDKDGRLVALIIGKLQDDEWVTILNPVDNAFPLLARHDVAVPGDSIAGKEEQVVPVPAEGLPANREAVLAYNRGVETSAQSEKIRLYRRAVELNQRFFEAWFNLGVALAEIGDEPQAVEAYEQALTLEPDSRKALRNLGRLHLEAGRFDAARRVLGRAVEAEPASAALRNELGETLRRAGAYEEAGTLFRAALELEPDYASAHFNLSLVLVELGDRAGAVAHLEHYLKLRPEADDAAQVRAWVAELRAN